MLHILNKSVKVCLALVGFDSYFQLAGPKPTEPSANEVHWSSRFSVEGKLWEVLLNTARQQTPREESFIIGPEGLERMHPAYAEVKKDIQKVSSIFVVLSSSSCVIDVPLHYCKEWRAGGGPKTV